MLPAASRIACAQAYPTRPVRLIVGLAPRAPDILARLMGRWLSDRLGQTFVVENRPGASGNLVTQAVIEAPADGYMLLLVSLSNSVNASLYEKLNFDFSAHIAPVAGISRDPDVMVVNPSFTVKSVPEFIAYAKANPGKINMASPGVGTSPHMGRRTVQVHGPGQPTHVPIGVGAGNHRSARRPGAGLLRADFRLRSNMSKPASFAGWR